MEGPSLGTQTCHDSSTHLPRTILRSTAIRMREDRSAASSYRSSTIRPANLPGSTKPLCASSKGV